jgi:hypothetical protein
MAQLTFGSIYIDTPAETTLDAATPTKAAGTTATMQLAGFTHPSSNRLTCSEATARVYEVAFCGSVTKGAGGSTQSDYAIYKNGSAITGATVGRTIASATDEGAFAVTGQVSLESGDYIELWLATDTGDELTIEKGVLSAKVLG